MMVKPQAEHDWFQPLIGDWKFSHACATGPDQPPSTTEGKIAVRSLGGLWYLMECSGDSPEGGAWTSLFTLGFDPERGRYVGTFVASMMTYLWTYDGTVDETGKRLVLDTEGPRFDGKGSTKYQDSIEIVDRDHWILRSRVLLDDGQWQQFLEGHHYRV